MKRLRSTFFLCGLLWLKGCDWLEFQPYDYEQHDDAKLKVKRYDCDIGIYDKRLYLKRKFGEAKDHDKK